MYGRKIVPSSYLKIKISKIQMKDLNSKHEWVNPFRHGVCSDKCVVWTCHTFENNLGNKHAMENIFVHT